MARELKPCGTPAAYRRHLRHSEDPCRVCRDAEAERQRPPGAPPRGRPKCGTDSGYRRHVKNREAPCRACVDAHTEAHRRWRAAVWGLPAAFVPHGLNGYDNYGCRCAVCSSAKSQDNAVRYEARRPAAR